MPAAMRDKGFSLTVQQIYPNYFLTCPNLKSDMKGLAHHLKFSFSKERCWPKFKTQITLLILSSRYLESLALFIWSGVHCTYIFFLYFACWQCFIHTCRCIPHSLCPVSYHLWHSSVRTGDSTGTVHQSGGNHVLEEGLPLVWRWGSPAEKDRWHLSKLRTNAMTAWCSCTPPFPGLGYAGQIIIFYGSISYMVILAWAFFYFFSSFSSSLPWTSCNNTWNTSILTFISLKYTPLFKFYHYFYFIFVIN